MSGKYFWIKERYNPQLGTYYVPCGNLTVKQARSMEKPLYGDNFMHRFSSEDEYKKRIDELKQSGERVH